ncbi:MAG: hypothetical protein CSA05_02420 [Bacteroidia bacterium]|nr:MAG: hypothetical protein CSA05_02420 [Bacteroidia bacterium]
MNKKEKLTTLLFTIFLGHWGIHRFYLGEKGRGVLYIVAFFFGLSWILWLIDIIHFSTIKQRDFDWKYNPHLFGKRARGKGFRNELFFNNFSVHIQTPNGTWQAKQQKEYLHKPNETYQEHSTLAQKGKTVLKKVSQLRKEILDKLHHSKQIDNSIVRDIKPMVDKYVSQVKELIERQIRLEHIIQRNQMSNINTKINNLKQKASETNSHQVKYEYQTTVAKLEKQRETIQEFIDESEMLQLRIDSHVVSLEQIKFDLFRVESLTFDEQRKEFTKMFEEKSADLSNYLSVLKESYDES